MSQIDDFLNGTSAPQAPAGPSSQIDAFLNPPRKRRTLAAIANDMVIEVANAAAGGVSSVANFIRPGNSVSGWIDKNIVEAGENSQSDAVKDEKQRFRQGVAGAEGVMDELGAVGRYVVDNPGLAAAQAVGSFVVPGAAVKGGRTLASIAGLNATRGGLAGGAAAGAAMAGGDAAGTAYELSTKGGATDEQAVAAGRQASVIPAVIGGVGGVVGAERLVAGAKGFTGNAVNRANQPAPTPQTVATDSGAPFASRQAAQQELQRQQLASTHEVAPAGGDESLGFVLREKGLNQAAVPAQQAQNAMNSVADRAPNWRTNAMQANQVARGLGIETKGKRLAQVVAEIDAQDAQQVATAQQQREDFRAAEAKRTAPGNRARAAAGDANPFKAFIAKHGIALEQRREFAPGTTEQRQAMVPGYGPIFRKTGKPLDKLAQAAVAESAMTAALGPVAGIGINVLKGVQEMGEGRYLRGLETMAPSVARGPLKAWRYGEEGVRDKTGIVVQDEVGAAELLGQAAGFSPSSVRNAFEGKGAIVQHDRALMARRSALVEQFAMAAMAGDEEGKAAAREDIAKFNEKNPNRRIQAMQLAQSVHQREKRIREAKEGVYLPSKRRDAMEAGRFAVPD